MLSLKKVLLTAIASPLAFAILVGMLTGLPLFMLGLTGVSSDMYRVQTYLAFLCSVVATCTYIIIRKIYEPSLDFNRWKNKDKMPSQHDMKTLLFFHVQS